MPSASAPPHDEPTRPRIAAKTLTDHALITLYARPALLRCRRDLPPAAKVSAAWDRGMWFGWRGLGAWCSRQHRLPVSGVGLAAVEPLGGIAAPLHWLGVSPLRLSDHLGRSRPAGSREHVGWSACRAEWQPASRRLATAVGPVRMTTRTRGGFPRRWRRRLRCGRAASRWRRAAVGPPAFGAWRAVMSQLCVM